LSLNPDGSEDYKIKIKGLDNIKVGDFTRKAPDPETGFGSLTTVDIALVEAAQAKLARRVSKSKKDAKESISNENDKADCYGSTVNEISSERIALAVKVLVVVIL
jgi:hypothetical protein